MAFSAQAWRSIADPFAVDARHVRSGAEMTTEVVDPASSLASLHAKISRTANPDHRRMLELLRERFAGALLADVARTVSGLSEDFVLVTRITGSPEATSAMDSYLAHLEPMYANGLMAWGEWDHIVVDDDGVIAEGQSVTLLPAAAAGVTLEESDDPDSQGLIRQPMTIIVEYTGGKVSREIVYIDSTRAVVTKLPAASAPDRTAVAAAVNSSR
jgi:hypothetical protein